MNKTKKFSILALSIYISQHEEEIVMAGDEGIPMCIMELRKTEKKDYPRNKDYNNVISWDTVMNTFNCWLGKFSDATHKKRQMVYDALIKLEKDIKVR